MSGWEYDDDYKRELARPSAWGTAGSIYDSDDVYKREFAKPASWGTGNVYDNDDDYQKELAKPSSWVTGNSGSHSTLYERSPPVEPLSRSMVSAISERVSKMGVSNLQLAGDVDEKVNGARGGGDAYLNIPVEVKGEDVPASLSSFEDMQFEHIVQLNIKRCGYAQPTPVQKHAIPICMSGRDLMASAQTGSGKTAAFCLPIIASILHLNPVSTTFANAPCSAPIALILSPTRELASQIHAEAKKFSHQTGLRVAVVYGGAPIAVQISQLDKGVDILVATPGRLNDLIERRRVSLTHVRYLVLDEADRMLDMGFEPQIRCIVEEAGMPSKEERQTMLFSATFPREIKELARKYLSNNNIFLSVGRVGSSTHLILQKVEYVDAFNKRNRLLELVKSHHINSGKIGKQLTVVFAQTKREVDSLENWLCKMGCRATSIHGDRTQYGNRATIDIQEAITIFS